VLERVLALGDASEGEAQPLFALALRDSGGRLHLPLTRGARLGVYRDSGFATAAARIVRRIHPDKSGRIGVVPVWLDAAFGAVAAAKAEAVESDDVYYVDGISDASQLVPAVTDHALAIADWVGNASASVPQADIGVLVDAFLKREDHELGVPG
jgi:hypothetical protein